MKIRTTQMKRTLIIALVAFAVIATSITDVQAGRALRKGIQGAAAGALIGAAIGGSDGAAKGAMIGGGVGIISGSNDNRRGNRHRRNDRHRKQHRRRAKQHRRRR